MSKIGNYLTDMWRTESAYKQAHPTTTLSDIHQAYEMHEPYTLGTYADEKLKRRDRKTIYTTYKIMMQDPTIAAALNLLVTAALGGHESRGEIVFVKAADKVKNKGVRANRLRKMVEREAPYLQNLINKFIFSFTRNGVAYGDSFARIYGTKKLGITNVICNELTETPLIQAFERAGVTCGYHVLENVDFEIKHITKLTTYQMIRMKMQRTTPVSTFKMENVQYGRILADDNMQNIPIIPSVVGGSLLQAVEPAWKDWVIGFAALNSQQIADSVNIQFATIDVSGMPEANQAKIKNGLIKSITELQNKVKSALQGGEEIFTTNWMFMPTWSNKQVLNPLGDLTQRIQPMNMELVMTHLKRGIGALGLDLSLLGWMEMISGGLGEGATFHTSAQVMNNAIMIRQAVTEPLIDLCILHFAYKYGEVFDRSDLPFQIEFYSDVSAAATEANNNRLNRANLTAMTIGSLAQLKELNLSAEDNEYLLTSYLGMDDEPAKRFSVGLAKAAEKEKQEQLGGPDGGQDDDQDLDKKDDDDQNLDDDLE